MFRFVNMFENWRTLDPKEAHVCSCDTLLEHWKKYSQSNEKMCSEMSCTKDAIMGCMAVPQMGGDYKFVVPLCEEHGRLHGHIITLRNTVVVLALNGPECGVNHKFPT